MKTPVRLPNDEANVAAPRFSTSLVPLAALVALPLALLFLNPQWMYAGSRRDPWLYFGYFKNLTTLVSGASDAYYATRLSVILPGWAFHSLLPPVAANTLLHLALFWVAVFALFRVGKELHGERAALFSALAMGSHPFFLIAIGTDYVDGFGLAYFLLALLSVTLACRPGSRRVHFLHLAAAGAFTTALLTANLFYGIYLPFLALHFAVLNGRGERRRLLPALFAFASGAFALFATFCCVSKLAGGRWIYVMGTLKWLGGAAGKENPFRSPAGEWLPSAGWLAVPLALFLGSLFAIGRGWKRDRAANGEAAPPLVSQLHLAGFGLLMLAFQLFHSPVFQFFFYASLILPFAFLALAGQIEHASRGLSARSFGVVAAASFLILVLPAGFVLSRASLAALHSAPAPVLVPAMASIVAASALIAIRKPAAAVLAFVLALSSGQFLASEVAAVDREFDSLTPDRRGVYVQIDRAVDAISRHIPSGAFYLWFDVHDRLGILYDPLSTTYLLCPRLVNMDFPRLPEPRTCDGLPLAPGTRLVLVSSRDSAPEDARAALLVHGLGLRVTDRETVRGAAPPFTLTFADVTRAERH